MIEVKGLTKYFDDFKALDDLSISVPSGSVYGLVGPNGSGKTTLIRHLEGIYKQDGGSVLVNSEPVWENIGVKENIASIPDDWFYYNSANIEDMKKIYMGMYPSFDVAFFDSLKSVFNLDTQKSIRYFSKGMQKQAAFWLAISAKTDYLLLDEPVDGLDPIMRKNVWSILLGEVAKRKVTVLVSSHNLRELEDVCDHVGILNHGHVVLERSLLSLQDNMVKLQVAFPEGVELPKDFDALHISKVGRVYTVIMRENTTLALRKMEEFHPVLVEAIPLTLEEIFIYELGGADYEIQKILGE